MTWPLDDGSKKALRFWTDGLGTGHITYPTGTTPLMAKQTVSYKVTTDQTSVTKSDLVLPDEAPRGRQHGLQDHGQRFAVVAGQTVTVTSTVRTTTGDRSPGCMSSGRGRWARRRRPRAATPTRRQGEIVVHRLVHDHPLGDPRSRRDLGIQHQPQLERLLPPGRLDDRAEPVSTAAGYLAATASAIARRCGGVLPQQAPMTFAPASGSGARSRPSSPASSRRRRPSRRGSAGRRCPSRRARRREGRTHLLNDGDQPSGPLPQLPPTAAAPASSRASAARSGETPIMVWPRVSKLIVAITGTSGAASRALDRGDRLGDVAHRLDPHDVDAGRGEAPGPARRRHPGRSPA